MRQRTAMLTIMSVSVVFTLCNILLSHHIGVTLLLLADIAIWTIANLWLSHKINKL
ncbi:MAG: hypothetical protein Q4D36_07165 [Bacteroidales bacterium]|nr:hypothetical protein [Bacteroidales bacterium]